MGTGLGAMAVAAAAFAAPGAGAADKWSARCMLVAAVLLFLAPSIDHGRRADRMLDGADCASAAATTALIGALARIAAILAPGGEIATVAALILVVAIGVRALPEEWRRGPALGIAVGGGVIAAIAGYRRSPAACGSSRPRARCGTADLTRWPGGTARLGAWQAPVALVLLGRRRRDRAAPALVVRRRRGLRRPGHHRRAGRPRPALVLADRGRRRGRHDLRRGRRDGRRPARRDRPDRVAAAVALHAVGASVVRPWTTAAALGIIVLIGAVVAGLARAVTTIPAAASAAG